MDNQQGPAGPTAFWKISDQIDEAKVDEWIDGWGSDSDEENDPDFDEGDEVDAEVEEEGVEHETVQERQNELDESASVEAVNGDGMVDDGNEEVVHVPHGVGIVFFTTS